MTRRLPTAAPALTVIVAVSEVPSPLTTMFEAVTFESIAPLAVMNLSASAPVRPTPLIVTVVAVPREKLPGAML